MWACVCAWACLLSGVGVRTSVMMRGACLLLYLFVLYECVTEGMFFCREFKVLQKTVGVQPV